VGGGMRRVMVIAIVGMLAACGSSGGGGSSSSGEGKDYADAIAAKLRSGSSADVFTAKQADCVANGMVDVIGVDTLNSAGLTPSKISGSGDTFDAVGKKLSESEANDLVEVIAGGKCFDFTDLVIKAARSSSTGSDPFSKLGETKTRCLFDKLLSGSAFKKAMVDSILGRESSGSDAFSKAFGNQSSTFKIFSDCNIKPSQLNG
jgi:hypothetical protein